MSAPREQLRFCGRCQHFQLGERDAVWGMCHSPVPEVFLVWIRSAMGALNSVARIRGVHLNSTYAADCEMWSARKDPS